MTPITKPVTRVSAVHVRDGGRPRALVVTLHPTFIEVRLHGTRRTETIDLHSAYFSAVKGRVFRERMEKAKKRKARVK